MDSFVAKTEFQSPDSYYLLVFTIILLATIGIYLWIIFIIGPKFMKDKLPYNVTNWLRFYNIFQVIACSIFVWQTYDMGFDFRFLWKCESFSFLTDGARLKIKVGLWCFLLLRVFEFSETIVFVLRKKKNQASFLHIYHHVSTVVLMWVFIAFDTELMAIYCGLINSFIHVIMYTYYFLSSFQSTRTFLNATKPVITLAQMVQFILILGHCIIAILPDCASGASGLFFYLQTGNLLILLCLFGHFFAVTYLRNYF